MNAKSCLFGGALFAAGLSATSSAQQFTFELREGGSYTTSEAYVYASNSSGSQSDYFMSYAPGAAIFNISAARAPSQATSKLSVERLEVFATAGSAGGSYAQARGFAYVSFDAGEQLRIVWDFSNEDPASSPFFSDIAIINMTTFNEEFGLDIANDPNDYAGDVTFTPIPGNKYSIRAAALAGTGGSTNAAISVALPAACPADLSGSSDPNDPAYGVPDGAVDAADFFYYLDQFASGNASVADLSGSSDPNDPAYGVPDGAVDSSDFFYYLDLFVLGCQ